MIVSVHPASTGGAYRDRHGRRKRDAVDAGMLSALARRRKHPWRTAKACGPDLPTLGSSLRATSPQATVATKPGHRGERAISVKTIAQGMPDCFGVPVVTAACFFVAGGPWVRSSIRHSLRPSHRGTRATHHPGISCRGNDESYPVPSSCPAQAAFSISTTTKPGDDIELVV